MRLRNTMRLTLGGALLCALLACETTPAPAALPEWQLSSSPITAIADIGTSDTQFGRIIGAVRLDNGDVLVGQGGREPELRLFGAAAEFKRRVARAGEGPNELSALGRMSRIGDTLVLRTSGPLSARWSLRTLMEIDRVTGDVAISQRSPRVTGALFGGARYGLPTAGRRALNRLVNDTLMRLPVEYAIMNPDGSAKFSLGERLSAPNLMIVSESAPMGFRSGTLRFAPQLHVTPATNVLWFGDSGTNRVGYLDARTGAIDSVVLPLAADPWNEPVIEAMRSRISREIANDGEREFPLALLDPKWRSASPPFFANLHGDAQLGAGDGVWVELFHEDERAPSRFLVLDSTGQPIARVNAPTAIRILEIGPDYLLGTEKDADDVESVVVYQLTR